MMHAYLQKQNIQAELNQEEVMAERQQKEFEQGISAYSASKFKPKLSDDEIKARRMLECSKLPLNTDGMNRLAKSLVECGLKWNVKMCVLLMNTIKKCRKA
jgi:phosphatidate phosphatase APP1